MPSIFSVFFYNDHFYHYKVIEKDIYKTFKNLSVRIIPKKLYK